ncbi:MAG: hypothetical protein IKG21_05975 [Atopobiaceae bacterium]|nr:hypothetical protein [Atopobiaceae bacterium]
MLSESAVALTGFIVSVALLVGGGLLFVYRRRHPKEAGPQPWHILCISILCAVLAFRLSQSYCGIAPSDAPVLSAIFSTAQMFLLESDMELDGEAAQLLLPNLAQPYLTYNAFLYLLAPITTVGAALFLLSQFALLPLLRLSSRSRSVFLFSHVTEDALHLAESVAANDPKHLVAFANADACEEEDLVTEVRAHHFLCMAKSTQDLLGWCNENARLHVLLSSEDEAENLHDALVLADLLAGSAKRTNEATIHVMSQTIQATSFVDAAAIKAAGSSACIRIRRISKNSDLVNRMLMLYPFFLPGMPVKGAPNPYEHERGHVVIVGHDDLCYEYLKSALWCGGADGLRVGVTVLGEHAKQLAETLAFDCPELYERGNSAREFECVAKPMESEAALACLRKNARCITHVLVSCGDDLQNVRLAQRIREVLRRENTRGASATHANATPTSATSPSATPIEAFVLVHMDDPVLASTLAEAKSPDGEPWNLIGIGNHDTTLSYKNVFHSNLERWAKNVNRASEGYYDVDEGSERDELGRAADDAFNTSEYTRSSAMASAIFLKHDLFSFCRRVANAPDEVEGFTDLPSADDWCLSLDDPRLQPAIEAYTTYVGTHQVDWLQRLESDRQASFVRALGFGGVREARSETAYAAAGRDRATSHLTQLQNRFAANAEPGRMDAMEERVQKQRTRAPLAEADRAVLEHLKDIVYDGEAS